MIQSYLITGWRNTLRHKSTSLISGMGLSLAVGVAVTVFIFMDFMFSLDHFHARRDRIFQVISLVQPDSQLEKWGDSPILLAPSLQADDAAVERSARLEFASGSLRYNDLVFNESIWFTDPAFLKMFSFPVVEGNLLALENPKGIVLTRQKAETYFGKESALGKTVSIKFSSGQKQEFIVTGILDVPENSSMRPAILLPMVVFEQLQTKESSDWSYLTDATFVMLKEGQSIHQLDGSVAKYKKLQNESNPQWMISGFEFIPLSALATQSSQIEGPVSTGPQPAGIWSLGVIAIMLLLLASFNYMNVAVATVSTRLKEIGIRKVIGSRKGEITLQFLVENMVLCTFALVLGAVMSYALFLPGFNTLFPFSLPFGFSSGNVAFLIFFGLLLFVSLVSGMYPAIYIASFTPNQILRGREKFGQRSIFSRVLLSIQLLIAFTTIVGSFVFIDNSLYQKDRDWGYDQKSLLTIPVLNREQYLSLVDKIGSGNGVRMSGGSVNHVGYQNTKTSFDHLEKKFNTIRYQVGPQYIETMGLQLSQGRSFQQEIQSDPTESVIINETFVRKMNWTEPLKESFVIDSVKRYVIGVVKDFHYDGFYDPIGPVMFTMAKEENLRYLVVRTTPNNVGALNGFIRTAWKTIAPDDPYEGFPQDDVFAQFHQDNNANIKLLLAISGMTMALACLGLFGLVSYNITRRLKEFSIRKVFGANLIHIFKLMNRDYAWILIISFVLGAPTGFLLMNKLIQHIYPDPQPVGVLPFALAITLMVSTVAITIGSQLGRIAKENPGKTLRSE